MWLAHSPTVAMDRHGATTASSHAATDTTLPTSLKWALLLAILTNCKKTMPTHTNVNNVNASNTGVGGAME